MIITDEQLKEWQEQMADASQVLPVLFDYAQQMNLGIRYIRKQISECQERNRQNNLLRGRMIKNSYDLAEIDREILEEKEFCEGLKRALRHLGVEE